MQRLGSGSAPVAVVFPGQGSQTSEMRSIVESRWPELLDLAAEVVGTDPFIQLERGNEYVQPAIYCTSVASWRGIRDAVEPAAFAGHSLGEFAALAAADAMDVEDGLRMATLRGKLTQRVAERQSGGMVAIGAELGRASALAEVHGLAVANHNSPEQVVLAGDKAAVRAASKAARADGLRSAVLDIEGAFHSPAMREAVAPFRKELERIRFRRPSRPVFCSTTARPFEYEDLPTRLAEGLVLGVQWPKVVTGLGDRGIHRFVEPEPGTVLCGLISKILPTAEVASASDLEARLGAIGPAG